MKYEDEENLRKVKKGEIWKDRYGSWRIISGTSDSISLKNTYSGEKIICSIETLFSQFTLVK